MTKGYQRKCQLCGVFGHNAKRCPQLHQQQTNPQQCLLLSPFYLWQPRANLAAVSPHPTNMWLLDNGATHRLTSDLHNLALHHPYFVDESVLIGDGSGLPITHTGHFPYPLLLET